MVQSPPVTQLWCVLRASLERLATAAPGWVLAALALYIVSLFIVGVRWRSFVRMLGGDIGTLRATLATLGGIAVGNLTPSSRLAGEACRMSLARVEGNVNWQQIAIATAWDRLSEIPAIAVLTIMAAFAVGRTGRRAALDHPRRRDHDPGRRCDRTSPRAKYGTSRSSRLAPYPVARAMRHSNLRDRRRLVLSLVAAGRAPADVRRARAGRRAPAVQDGDVGRSRDAWRAGANDRRHRCGGRWTDGRPGCVRRSSADRRGDHGRRTRNLVRVQHRRRCRGRYATGWPVTADRLAGARSVTAACSSVRGNVT